MRAGLRARADGGECLRFSPRRRYRNSGGRARRRALGGGKGALNRISGPRNLAVPHASSDQAQLSGLPEQEALDQPGERVRARRRAGRAQGRLRRGSGPLQGGEPSTRSAASRPTSILASYPSPASSSAPVSANTWSARSSLRRPASQTPRPACARGPSRAHRLRPIPVSATTPNTRQRYVAIRVPKA